MGEKKMVCYTPAFEVANTLMGQCSAERKIQQEIDDNICKTKEQAEAAESALRKLVCHSSAHAGACKELCAYFSEETDYDIREIERDGSEEQNAKHEHYVELALAISNIKDTVNNLVILAERQHLAGQQSMLTFHDLVDAKEITDA